MDNHWDTSWSQSPNGSRAEDPQEDYYYESHETHSATQDPFYPDATSDAVFMASQDGSTNDNSGMANYMDDIIYEEGSVFGTETLPPGAIMSNKIPPSYNGMTSWFVYEEHIYDWLDITILD